MSWLDQALTSTLRQVLLRITKVLEQQMARAQRGKAARRASPPGDEGEPARRWGAARRRRRSERTKDFGVQNFRSFHVFLFYMFIKNENSFVGTKMVILNTIWSSNEQYNFTC